MSIAEHSRPLSNKGQSPSHYAYARSEAQGSLIHSSRDMNLKTRYIITIHHEGRRPEALKRV